MEATYTAVIQHRQPWWIGWIEEVPGVSSQGATRDELLENLQSALDEAVAMDRADAAAPDAGSLSVGQEELNIGGPGYDV